MNLALPPPPTIDSSSEAAASIHQYLPLSLRLSIFTDTDKFWQLTKFKQDPKICRQDLMIFADFSGASKKEK